MTTSTTPVATRMRRWISAAGAAAVLTGTLLAGQAAAQAAAPEGAAADSRRMASLSGRVVTSDLNGFDSDKTKTATAECPAGKVVIGGTGRINNGRGNVVINRLEPVHNTTPDSFKVTASEDEGGSSSNWAVQAFAICADPLPGYQIVSNTSPPGSNAINARSVACLGGRDLLGMGGRISGGTGEIHLAEVTEAFSRTSATAKAREDANGFAGNWRITVFGVCARADGFIRAFDTDSDFDSGNPKIVSAACPSGTSLVGASYSITSTGAQPAPHIVLESLQPQGFGNNRLQLIGRENVTTGDRWSMEVEARCLT